MISRGFGALAVRAAQSLKIPSNDEPASAGGRKSGSEAVDCSLQWSSSVALRARQCREYNGAPAKCAAYDIVGAREPNRVHLLGRGGRAGGLCEGASWAHIEV